MQYLAAGMRKHWSISYWEQLVISFTSCKLIFAMIAITKSYSLKCFKHNKIHVYIVESLKTYEILKYLPHLKFYSTFQFSKLFLNHFKILRLSWPCWNRKQCWIFLFPLKGKNPTHIATLPSKRCKKFNSVSFYLHKNKINF